MDPNSLVIKKEYCWLSGGKIGTYDGKIVHENVVKNISGRKIGTSGTTTYYKFTDADGKFRLISVSNLNSIKSCESGGGKRKSRSRKYRNKRKSRKYSKKFY